MMRKLHLLTTLLFSMLMSSMVYATTCPNAQAIPGFVTTPTAVACGATAGAAGGPFGTVNELTTANVPTSCANPDASALQYFAGFEALYTFTPTVTGSVDIRLTGTVTWTGIMVYNGCPTSAGTTCLGAVSSSVSAKTLSVNMTAGTQYYIMFDTWPTPDSPCGALYTIAPTPAPGCTTNSSPAAAATGQSTTPTLSWAVPALSATAGTPSSYDIYLGTTLPGVLIGNSATTTFTVPASAGLTFATSYTWYVVPKNATGAAVGCSANNTTFTTTNTTPACPVLSAPVANSTTVIRQPTLTWAAAAGASSYQVFVGTTNPPTAGTIAGVTFPVSTTSLSYVVPSNTLTNGVAYFWAIVPVNGLGASTACQSSTARGFTVTAATSPAAPANDEPCFAAMLPINPSGAPCASTVAGTTLNATNTVPGSFGTTNPICGLTTGTPKDVWYYVTTGAIGNLNLKLTQGTAGGAASGSIAVYSISGAGCGRPIGSTAPTSSNPTLTALCSAVTPVAPTTSAQQSTTAFPTTPVNINAALSPNTTYLVRVGPNGSTDAGGAFTLCATEILPPPNDRCADAVDLPVDINCTTITQTINAFANDEGDATCGAGAQKTIFYKFTAASSNMTVVVDGGADFRPVSAVLSSCGGAPVAGGACASAAANDGQNTSNVTGLTPGSIYFIRIYDFDGTGGTFTVCAKPTQTPPVNDDQCAAIALTVANACSYGTYVNTDGSLTAATPGTSCTATGDADVWFTATVPASGLLSIDLNVSTAVGANITDAAIQVYAATGTTGCAIFTGWTNVACADNAGADLMPTANLSALTPGTLVYIRVWGKSGATGSFSICVTDPIPPANDEPCNAVALSAPVACTSTTGTTYVATSSTSIAAPASTCGTYSGADVWYSVVVPASGIMKIATTAGLMTDAAMEVYTGSCTAMTAIACNDNGTSPASAMPNLIIATQPAGTQLYIRVYPNGTATTGSFGICATEIVPAPCVNSGGTASQFPSAIANPTPGAATIIATNNWKSEYSVMTLTAGVTYRMGNCTEPATATMPALAGVNGGGTGTTITLTDAAGLALSPPVFSAAYGAGTCVTFTPTVTGNYRMYIADYPCATSGAVSNTTVVAAECITPSVPTVTATVQRCGAGTVNLTGTACTTGTLTWYSNAALTTVLGTGVSFTTASLAAGTYTYYGVCQIAATCKSAGAPVTITVKAAAPVVTASLTDVTCSGPVANSDGTITLSGFGATDFYQYSTGSTFDAASAVPATAAAVPTGGVIVNNLANPSASQPYTIRITSASGAGCFIDVTVTQAVVNCAAACVNPAAPTNPVNQSICVGANTLAAPLAVDAPGTGFVTNWYQSSTGGIALATATNTFAPSPLPSVTTTYYAETQATGYSPACVSTTRTAVTLTRAPLPTLSITNPAPVCSPATVDITAAAVTAGSNLQGGILAYFTTAAATTVYATPTAATAGTYYIKVTSTAGCTAISPVTVTITAPGTAPTVTSYTICQNAPVPTGGGVRAASCTRQVVLPLNIVAQPTEVNAAPGNVFASVSLASLPAGTTLSGININIPGITVLGGSWQVDMRIGLANALTGAAASGIGALSNATSPFTYNQTFTAAAGLTPVTSTLDFVYWDNFDDNAADEAIFPLGPNAGTITLTYNDPADIKWYAAATGGTSFGSGTPFNPVGVTGSGITSTSTPGTTTLYASCETGGCPGPRTAVDFIVAPTPVVVTNAITACGTSADLTAAAVTAGTTLPTGATFSYWADAAGTTPIPASAGTQTAITVGGTYYIKATTPSGCTDIKPVTVTITAPPAYTAGTTAVTCTGLTANSDGKITLSGFAAGNTYQYSVGGTFDAATAIPATATAIPTGGMIASTLANPATTQTYTVRVFSSATCFTDATVTLSNVNCAATCTPPAAPTGASGASICAGSNVPPAVAVDAPGAGKQINWYDAATGGTLLQSNSEVYSLTTVPTATTTYYAETEATGYSSACVSTTRTAVTVTVNPVPMLTTTAPAAVCTPATVNLTAPAVTAGSTAGTTLTYWIDAAATANPVSNPAQVPVGGTYYIRSEDAASGCFIIKSVQVTINTAPVAPAMTNYTICQGAAVPAGAGMNSTSCLTPSGPVVVIPIDIAAQPVEVNTLPGNVLTSFTLPATPAGTVIGSITINIPGIQALGGSWMSEVRLGLSGGVTNAAATSPGSANTAGTFTYNRAATINGLPSGSAVNILYWNSSNDNTGADDTFITGTGVGTVSVQYVQSGITWYTASTGGTAIATGAVLNPVGVAGSGLANTNTAGVTTYYASCNNGSCEGARASVTFTINPTPNLVTNPISVCLPSSANLTAATVTTGSTLPTGTVLTYWSNAAATTAIPASSGTSSAITVAGKYYIKATLGSCTDIDSVVVMINPLPAYTAIATDITCNGPTSPNADGTITLSGFGATDTYQYSLGSTFAAGSATAAATIPSGGIIVSNLSNPVGSQAYTVRVFGAGGCFTDRTVSLNNVDCAAACTPPAAPATPVNQTICANVTALATPLSVAAAGAGFAIDWYSAATGGTLLASNINTYTPSPLPTATTTYYAETRAVGYSPACVSDTRTAVMLTIAPLPELTITNPASACAPATVDMTAAAVTAGSTLPTGTVLSYWANAAATTAIPAASGTPAAITVGGTYYIKATSPAPANCVDIKAVTVSINTVPGAPTVANFNICQGGTPLAGQGMGANGCAASVVLPITIAAQPAGEVASPVTTVTVSGVPAGSIVTSATIAINGMVSTCTGTFASECGLSVTGGLTIANGNGNTAASVTGPYNYSRTITLPAGTVLTSNTLNLLYTEGASGDCTGNDAIFPIGSVGTVTLNYQAAPVWYAASTGGTSVGSGTPFNPIGVAGTGVANTNTPGTTTLYAACTSSGCEGPRVAVNFTVDAPSAGPTIPNITVCEGSPISALNFTPCENDTVSASVTASPITSDGLNTPLNYTITLPALPAYATVVSANLVMTNVVPAGGVWLSELRAAVSGAATLATTAYSTTNSTTALASVSIPITISNAGSTATVALSQTFNGSASPDATYGGVKIEIVYNQPLNWYDAATGGTQLATGAASCNFTPANQPLTNAGSPYTYYAQYTNAQGCQSARAPWTVTVTPNSSMSLAGTSTPNVSVCDPGGINHNDDGNYTYTTPSCERIATVDDNAGGNILGMTNACVTVQSGTPTAPSGQPYLPRSFQITPTNNGPATVTLYMLQSELDALVGSSAINAASNPTRFGAITPGSYANMCIYKYSGGSQSPGSFTSQSVIGAYPSGVTVSAVPGTSPVQYSVTFPVTGFSGFYCAACNPNASLLPVDLLSFTGRTANNINILNWATATELNNAKFEIERSLDGINFEYIGEMKGAGTTNARRDYVFADNQPLSGSNFYRLRQVDLDGKFNYSKTILLNLRIDKLSIGTIVPNPTSGQLGYTVYSPTVENATLTVRNVLGQVVYSNSNTLKAGNNALDFDATNLAAGSYMIFVQDAKGRIAQKQFIKIDR